MEGCGLTVMCFVKCCVERVWCRVKAEEGYGMENKTDENRSC